MACCDAQIDQNRAPVARSLAKMEEPALEPWAAEPALLKSLGNLAVTSLPDAKYWPTRQPTELKCHHQFHSK